jgi:DHA1 family inner membrane transport protein
MTTAPAGTSAPPARVDPLSSTRPLAAVAALAALAVSAFCFFATENLPVGLLPAMASGLHTSLSSVGLLVSGYGATVAVVSVPLTLATRRMPRRVLLSGLLAVFVVATSVSAVASSYWMLLLARVVTALAQSIFWSIAAVTAAGLFSPKVRGRVVSGMFGGSTLATILGVPAGTWVGQRFGWRVPFAGLSALGLVALLAIAVLLPTGRPGQGHAATGADPDPRRYWLLVLSTALVITGVFTSYTYVSPFLTEVSGFSAQSVGPLLALRGVAGLAGLLCAGTLIDRLPRAALLGPVGLLAATLLGLYLFGTSRWMAAVLTAVLGLAMSVLVTSLAVRVMQVAPGSSDLASAGNSASFNVGIAGGSFIGGLLLPAAGVRSTALVGGLFAAAALAVVFAEPVTTATRRLSGVRGRTG